METSSKNSRLTGLLGLTVSLVFLVAACSGGGNSNAADQKPPTGTEPSPPTQPVDEIINGIKVPPLPDPTVNDSTQAGVDSNANGIRDDVERILVKEFGANKEEYDQAITFAIAEQNLVVKQDEGSINHYIRVVSCETDLIDADRTDKLTYALLNTEGRGNAYGNLLAGRSDLKCE